MNKLARLSTAVRIFLEKESCGHDYFHAVRVSRLANLIMTDYPVSVDALVIEAATLVHDICRPFEAQTGKSHFGPEALAIIAEQLQLTDFSERESSDILEIVRYHDVYDPTQIPRLSHELMIHQDADRLDAIGAIGIARTFAFGGANRLLLYNPGESLNFEQPFIEDPSHRTSTIAHFYEKLLKLQGQMHTETGKALATKRHEFMVKFLETFFSEWGE